MEKDPLSEVYAYVERAYLRLQAGDLLNRCLEEGSDKPIQPMLEQLILAGPKSLDALREIVAETEKRVTQVLEDRYRLLREIENSLLSCGVDFGELKLEAILRLSRSRFLHLLSQQNLATATQLACLQIQRDSRDLLRTLNKRLQLLEEIEGLIKDWMWGLAIQSAHLEDQSKDQR